MIAKIPPGRQDGKSSFRDLGNYILGRTGHSAGSVLHVGFQNLTTDGTAALEMEVLASENTRSRNPVFHFILSWREMERPTSEQVDEAVQIALKELGLEGCQALWALQDDTENQHAHVMVNRIDPETYRAIQPAGNWTKKALERAARKIELAQGWEVERSGRYDVNPDGTIQEKGNGNEPKLTQKSRDIEAHTGAKSWERLIKEQVGAVLRDAISWGELHQKLGELGLSMERKGSGAVLLWNDGSEQHAVKVSTVDRGSSLKKLEARLGAFQEREHDVEVSLAPQMKPVEVVAAEPALERTWKGYMHNRTDYFRAKSAARATLRERQKQEYTELLKRQKQERQKLFQNENWKGRGKELNQRRSLLAAKHVREKLNQRDAQKQETENLNSRFLQHFPSFKTWLKEQEDGMLFLKYRYPGQTVLTSPSQKQNIAAKVIDIRNFMAFRSLNGTAWGREKGVADFIDAGRRIVMRKGMDHDETAILAALQLANQKWGTAQINGTDEEYRRMCVQVAIQHNLRIANPDLRKAVEEGRKRMYEGQSRGGSTEVAKNLLTRYAKAVGAERFRIVVTEFTREGTQAFVLDRRNGGLSGKTLEELQGRVRQLEGYAAEHKNINITPMSKDKHHILVDDLTVGKLAAMKADGYSPSCVIESSPGNFQAIITIPSLSGDATKEREAANRLTKVLNELYGDPKLSGAIHAHRLPPFGNFKPKHRREDGSYPPTRLVEAGGGMCHKASEELRGQVELLASRKALEAEQRKIQAAAVSISGASDPDAAYWLHYEDITRRFRGALDYSQVDGMIGIRMRVTGYDAGQIAGAIEHNAAAMRQKNMSEDEFRQKYRYRNWRTFSSDTTEKFVFGARGEFQYRKAEQYRPYLLKLEGRGRQTQKNREDYRGR